MRASADPDSASVPQRQSLRARIHPDALKRVPLWVLVTLVLSYALPGFIGREPWKSEDIMAFFVMQRVAEHATSAWTPEVFGVPAAPGWFAYWLGAHVITWTRDGLEPDLAVRLLFAGVLLLAMAAFWLAARALGQHEELQPYPPLFSPPISPARFAACQADLALLVLLANLGLLARGHETTPALLNLALLSLAFCGFGLAMSRQWVGQLLGLAALLLLALDGEAALALVTALGFAAELRFQSGAPRAQRWLWQTLWALLGVALVLLLIRDYPGWHMPNREAWSRWLKMLAWFFWPAWPLVLGALWFSRGRWLNPPTRVPVLVLGFVLVASLLDDSSDTRLLLALPPVALLAVWALPRMPRAVLSLVDFFALAFFTLLALYVWLGWVAVQFGWPAQLAAQAARLLPGFVAQPHWVATLVASILSAFWLSLVLWRARRHRRVLWRSMVLSTGGVTLLWALVTTLWLPLINYARSYAPVVAALQRTVQGVHECVAVVDVRVDTLAALAWGSGLRFSRKPQECYYLIYSNKRDANLTDTTDVATFSDLQGWRAVWTGGRPADRDERFVLLARPHPRTSKPPRPTPPSPSPTPSP